MTEQDLNWHKAADAGQLDDGEVAMCPVGIKTVALTKLDGRYGAIDNRCPHQGGPLGQGTLENDKIRCPWHGWEFDIRTGQSYCDPRRFRARAYPATVEPGAAVVKGPYIAETIKVAVESDYVVVDL